MIVSEVLFRSVEKVAVRSVGNYCRLFLVCILSSLQLMFLDNFSNS